MTHLGSVTSVALIATFTARPGQADTVARLIAEYAELVRAEEGNRLFEPSQSVGEPARFVVYEQYEDTAAFEKHLTAPKGEAFNAILVQLILEPQSVLEFLQPV